MPAELATSLAPTEADRLLQAEALVRGYCGWHIAPSRSETITVRTFGGTSVMLPSLLVTEVALGLIEALANGRRAQRKGRASSRR